MKQFEVWLVALDPAKGHEISKTRPCVIISPNEMDKLKTRLVAPLTSTIRNWSCRVRCQFQHVTGEVALDQMRCVDARSRGRRFLGHVDDKTANQIKQVLREMFS